MDNTLFEMHRLVQLATRKRLTGSSSLLKTYMQYILLKNRRTGASVRPYSPYAKSAEVQRPPHEETVGKWGVMLRKAAWCALAKWGYSKAEGMSLKSNKSFTKGSWRIKHGDSKLYGDARGNI